jgi:hypothetical protein
MRTAADHQHGQWHASLRLATLAFCLKHLEGDLPVQPPLTSVVSPDGHVAAWQLNMLLLPSPTVVRS